MRHHFLLGLLLVVTGARNAHTEDPPPLYVFADIKDGELGLINTETDQLVQVDVVGLEGWPGNGVVHKQHSWVTHDGRTIYMSIDGTPPSPAGIVVFDLNSVDWDAGTADVSIQKTLIVDPPGVKSTFPKVEQVTPDQPIAHWTQPGYTQIHGPSLRPRSSFSYATIWTDNRIVALDTDTNEFDLFSPFSFGNFSRHSHGLAFNRRGNFAFGTGYYYDQSSVDLYFFFRDFAFPIPIWSIPLRKGNKLGAFTHYTVWLNNRYAYTATEQFDRTSLTPRRKKISSPAIWLLDLWTLSAERVVGTATNVDQEGVLRSPSDVNIANGKLYVAEEDTLDNTFADDGFVSVFDLSRPRRPRFIKRLKPGTDLPHDFAVAHGLTVTPDQKYVFVASWVSHYIAKIDTATDTVAAVWGPDDGLFAPHGGFIAGSNR